MKVKELIILLNTLPLDSLVVMAKDEEGNNFSPLADDTKKQTYSHSIGFYIPESTHSGEFYDVISIKEYYDKNPEETVEAVCLWPIN